MVWLKTILFIALTLSFATVLDAAELVAMRAYEHKDYHRLTIIISEDVPLTAVKEDERVILKIRELAPKALKELPRTDVIIVKGMKGEADVNGPYSALEVAIPAGSKVVQTVKAGPFRVILDVYPPPGFGSKKTLDPHMMAVLLEQDASRVMAFNDSWRWVYRKKVVDMMRQDLYDPSSAEAFRAAIGLDARDRNTVSVEGAKAVMRLKSEGQTGDAALLDAIMHFYSGNSGPLEFENALRASKASIVKGLGHFLLAEHFERKGFFPEASGYYTLAAGTVKKGPLRALSVFRKARLLFFDHKYSDAKESFKKAVEEGYADAAPWLANTLIIRGEVDPAWELMKNLKPSGETDPVTRLGLADMQLLKGNFQEARFQFASMRSRYSKDGFIGSYLLMREGDTYFLEGKRVEAMDLYSKSKEKLKGEPWAIVSLSLADACFVVGTREALEKAEKIFESVALGTYEGSVIVNLRLIATRMAIGRYREAYEDVKRFHASYPTSPFRQDVNRLSQSLFYGWIDALVTKGDHIGAVKLFSETTLSVPFGKKAEVSLKIAKSYKALGLLREAAGNLDTVIKIGTEPMAEEAMLLLANIYLDQNDIGSAERLMKAFATRFQKTKKTAEKELVYARMAFAKKDYSASSAFNGSPGDAAIASMRADSLAKTGRPKEASAAFESAARIHGERGEDLAAKNAWLRSADAKFATGDFKGAAEAYGIGLKMAGASDREDRSWALYRLAKCYSNLNMKEKEAEALKELKAQGGEFSQWSEKIFEEARSL